MRRTDLSSALQQLFGRLCPSAGLLTRTHRRAVHVPLRDRVVAQPLPLLLSSPLNRLRTREKGRKRSGPHAKLREPQLAAIPLTTVLGLARGRTRAAKGRPGHKQ